MPIAADHFGLAARVRASLPELADQYDAARLARVEPGGFLWRDIVDPYARLALDEIKTAITWTTEEFAAAYSAGGAKAPEPTSLDVAFSLEQNQYNGETYVELTVADLRKSDDLSL